MLEKLENKNALSKRICPHPLCTCFLQVDEKHAKPTKESENSKSLTQITRVKTNYHTANIWV